MATNKFYNLGQKSMPVVKPKIIEDLQVDETYTIYGKEENYTEHGIL